MGAEQIYQARWVTLKKIVDDHRDDIYRAMLNLELAGPYPMPKNLPGIDADKPLRIGMAERSKRPPRPPVVCLCGSVQHMDTFNSVDWRFTLAGEIVITVALYRQTDTHGAVWLKKDAVRRIVELDFRKIDLADRVFILNVDGYIGDSTCRELAYALGTQKRVAFLEPEAGEEFIKANRGRLDALIKELGVEEW